MTPLSHAASYDDALRRALAPFTLDGTEACKIIRNLVDAVLEAKGDVKAASLAEGIAMLQMQRLLEDLAPVEAMLNALARLQEHRTIDFGEVLRGFVEQQLRFRANERDKGEEI